MTTNEKALMLHEEWKGKLETVSKATVASREDLALAYTPGVAEPCKVIAKDPEAAYLYTAGSTHSPSAWTLRTPRKSLRQWSASHLLLEALIWRTLLPPAVLR